MATMAKKKRAKEAEIERVLSPLREQIKKMAHERDVLRNMLDEFESVAESWDRGVDDLESGLLDLQRGLDSCSEML